VCSSFVWVAARFAQIHLETPGAIATPGDLETVDESSGAEVDGQTRDGLYLYREDERLNSAQRLYAKLRAQILGGFFERLAAAFNDMDTEIPNQLVNCFAFDSCGPGAGNNSAWQMPGVGRAVSPDNIALNWDAPRIEDGIPVGLYGHLEPLVYYPEVLAYVDPMRWKRTSGRLGWVRAIVTLDGLRYTGALVRLLDQTAVSDAEGEVRFQVLEGDYPVFASSTINGFVRESKASAVVAADEVTDVTIALQLPDPNYRVVSVSGPLTIWESSFGGFDDDVGNFQVTGQRGLDPDLNPLGSILFVGHPYVVDDVGLRMRFDVQLMPDRSVEVRWKCEHWDGSGDNPWQELYTERHGSLSVPEDEFRLLDLDVSWPGNNAERYRLNLRLQNARRQGL